MRPILPLPLGEGWGEGLTARRIWTELFSGHAVGPHPNPLPRGEGTGVIYAQVSAGIGSNERPTMKLSADKQADALYLRLDDSTIVESDEVSPGVSKCSDQKGAA